MFSRNIRNASKPLNAARAFSTSSTAADHVSDAMTVIRENQFVDFRFTDLNGTWHHMTFPSREIEEGVFENGIAFDGSSVIGWKAINESDMVFLPDPATVKKDPFTAHSTAVAICDIKEVSGESYARDPRAVLAKTNDFVASSGAASFVNVGPEGEFFMFDGVRIKNDPNSAMFDLHSDEAFWCSDADEFGQGNLGMKIQAKGGYFPVPPTDKLNDVRNDMVLAMEELGLNVEAAHHEVGVAQCEIDIRFDKLLAIADKWQWYKHCVRNVAYNHGKLATFMAKPLFGDNGSGMHCHVSFHSEDGTNQFLGEGPAGLSEQALHFVGGLQAHARALCVLTNPTTNSYKRLVPGFEAPTNIVYSACNRSAAIRIPNSHPKARRLEYRTPDPTANPYLAFSAIIMAGMDGIINKLDPGMPTDVDLYELSPEELGDIVQAPASLDEAVDALKGDRAWLEAGNVFSPDLVDKIIELKSDECSIVNQRPHPMEFQMYMGR